MSDQPLVSIVLGSYNRLEFVKLAIESARRETETIPHEIIVVDGGSDDGTMEWLLAQKDVITIVQHNRGTFNDKPIQRRSWGYFMNLVFKSAQGKYVLMMSDDTLFLRGAVINGIQFIETETAKGRKIGAVPFYFHDVGHDPQDGYKVFTIFDKPFLNHGIYVGTVLREVGFADEKTYQFYASDVDICFKMLHAGYEVAPCETALMLHCPNHPTRYMTSSNEINHRDITALMNKWHGKLIDTLIDAKDVETPFIYTTYHDPDEMAHYFDEALRQQSTPTTKATSDSVVQLQRLEERLNNLIASTRYHIQMSEQNHLEWQKNRNNWELRWADYSQKWFLAHRPLYRRMLSHWVIFAPLRALKNKITKKS